MAMLYISQLRILMLYWPIKCPSGKLTITTSIQVGLGGTGIVIFTFPAFHGVYLNALNLCLNCP